MEKNNSIKIHYISTPIFTYGGVSHCVETIMFKHFGQIDKLIQKTLKIAKEKKMGNLDMVIHSISNMNGDKLIFTHVETEPICFMRYKFIKSIDGETPKPYKLNEKYENN